MKLIGAILIFIELSIIPAALGNPPEDVTTSVGKIPYAYRLSKEQMQQYTAKQLMLLLKKAVDLAQQGKLDDAIFNINYALALLNLMESGIVAAMDNPLTVDFSEYDISGEKSRIAVMKFSLGKFKQIFESAREAGLSVEVTNSKDNKDVTITVGDNKLVYDSETGLLKDAELVEVAELEAEDMMNWVTQVKKGIKLPVGSHVVYNADTKSLEIVGKDGLSILGKKDKYITMSGGVLDGKKGVKVSVQKVHITYDKYGRAVTTSGRVYESGYDNEGNLILNKEYEMKRTVTEFTEWGAPKSESITTYDTSGAKDLTVEQNVEYEYDLRGRAVYTKTTTHEFGDRGPDTSGDEDYEQYIDKTTITEETVISFNNDGNPEEVHIVQTTKTGKGSMIREYDEHRDYENGRLVSTHQYNGTVTGQGDDGSNISYEFENTTDYTYNEIGQIVKTHSTEWSSGTFGGDTDISEYNNTSDTIYAYDIYGRTLMQLTETFDSANNTHYLSGFMADPSGSGFNDVGELSDQYSINVHFGAQDGQGNFNYNMDIHYMDDYGFEQLFNMFLTGGTAEGDGYTGDGFYSGGGPIADSWKEYMDSMAGAGMDVTSGWGL